MKMIGVAKERGSLYYFSPDLNKFSSAHLAVFDIWHWRLGHISYDRLNSLSKQVDVISITQSVIVIFVLVPNKQGCPFLPVVSIVMHHLT